jgi:predicted ATP-binding protein involved in virulence
MRLSKLALVDFRGFKQLDLDFGREVTILVGVNGAGKTSLLDATALMLTWLTTGVVSGRPRGTSLTPGDVRVGASGASVTLSVELGGQVPKWTVATTLPGYPRTRSNDLEALTAPISAAQSSIAREAPQLPLAVYFPTNRSALDIPARIRTPHEFTALSAYDGALEGGASNFRGFFEWFREEEDVFNEQAVSSEIPAAEKSPLPRVRRAVEALFPGASELRVERRPQKMTLLYRGVRLDVAQLSDGEKCVLAMVGDLARRMVLASPGADDPLQQEAVVLIDELELHLHPGLQRTILPRLREVFPNTQFVVSTHSPQVLSSVRAENVRLLEGFEQHPIARGTWRRDTNRILETAFADPGRPLETATKLNALRDAVDAGQHDEARRLVRELRAMIEGDDPDVFFLEQLLPPEDGAGIAR